jgi:hypothetical protein
MPIMARTHWHDNIFEFVFTMSLTPVYVLQIEVPDLPFGIVPMATPARCLVLNSFGSENIPIILA